MPPIGRGLALVVSFLVGWAADRGLTLDPEQVTIIMMSIYAAVHTGYRKVRKEKTGTGEV